MSEPHFVNHLAHEKSPYLLQHVHNPVDWYPWGEEAFRISRELNRPIFLSIGYATCHWCHVMERECFENEEIAKLMNDAFVNVKIDREELPHIDNIYMEFAQSMMTGAAGWPLNVVLTPELKPFFATTYLPPESTYGLMGLKDLILRLQEIWQGEEREKVAMQAEKIVEVFARNTHSQGEKIPDKQQVDDAALLLFKMADPVYGGMKETPKFPIGYQLSFLMRHFHYEEDHRSFFFVERTLDMMQRGGIYDHVGGGFSRYSVDEKWLVPHFEKMIYDNAILLTSYLEAWQISKKELYRNVAEEVIQYVLKEMTDPLGGFYSAEDAESSGKEGFYYTWEKEEITRILGEQNCELFCEFFGVTELGNFEGRNILHTPLRIEEFAAKKGIGAEQLETMLLQQKNALLQERKKRERPLVDDKILCSRNGMMIHSLAEAAVAFNNKGYLAAAVRAAEFIKENMYNNGRLLRRYCKGEALYPACLEDYAFMVRGALTLFESGCGARWLEWAIEMNTTAQELFKAPGGAYFQVDESDQSVILRKCQFSDGAEPSGNAIQCENLLRLYQITLDDLYFVHAGEILKAVKKNIDSYSLGYCYHLMNLARFYDYKAPTIIISLNKKGEFSEQISKCIYEKFTPNKLVVWRREEDEALFRTMPFVEKQKPIDNKTTLYICYEGICKEPINELSEIIKAIEEL